MSFICKVCGAVKNGEKQTKVPTKIRDVEYNLQVKTIYANGEAVKTVRTAKGTEIVEENSYCKKHVPEEFEPVKEGNVIRNQLIKIIAIKKNNEEVNEDNEENKKRSHRNKDKKEQ